MVLLFGLHKHGKGEGDLTNQIYNILINPENFG